MNSLCEVVDEAFESHSKQATKYARWKRCLSVSALLVGSSTTALSYYSAGRSDCDRHAFNLSLSVSILATITTVLQAVENVVHFGQKSAYHSRCSSQLRSLQLELNIRTSEGERLGAEELLMFTRRYEEITSPYTSKVQF